jgi:hypothetical protein
MIKTKKTRIAVLLAIFAFGLLGGITAGETAAAQSPAKPADLPEYLRVELTRILLTWDILDKCAAGVWPGWTTYREVPFLINYPNGVKLLVGHPDPMDGFTPVPGLLLRGKAVLLDRRHEIALPIAPPVTGGGGVLALGKTKPVQTVDLNLAPVDPKAPSTAGEGADSPLPPELKVSSDSQILINIHELFHCFQREVYRYRFGNLQMNPVADYAVYSELEGIALEKAYKAEDPKAAREFLFDFLAARDLKRKTMTGMEANQESEEELLEGTAFFSEARVLEQLRSGYSDAIPEASTDPYFHGFARADLFLEEKLDSLRKARRNSLEARNRSYSYGCFQALLLTRLYPAWRDGFFQSGKMMDQAIREHLAPSEADMAAAGQRLEGRYPIAEIRARNGNEIRKRDEALAMIQARRGRTYIVNFKPTQEYLAVKSRGGSYAVGLINIHPEGIERIQIRDVVFEGAASPIVQDQLYYVKWIDTEAKPGERSYTLTFGKKEGEDIYIDAVFTTGGFTLRAPKIQIRETPERVKVTILAKLKGSNP